MNGIYNAPSVMELRSHCPGSGALSAKVPRTEQTEKGKKGDEVHAAIMAKLQDGTEPKELNELYDRNTVDLACKLVDKRLKKLTGKGLAAYRKKGAIECEKPLNLGHVDWDGRAKADVVIRLDKTTVLVLEIKTGEWEVTGPSANRQGHDYLCGERRLSPEVKHFYLAIVQPALVEELQWREAHYTDTDVDDLALQLQAFREATYNPNAPLLWGDWCSKCPANEMCPARMGTLRQMEQLLAEAPTVALHFVKLSPKERSETMAKMKLAKNQSEKFLDLAKAWLLNTPTAEIPGWKVGPGKGSRKFSGSAPDTAKSLYKAFGGTLKAKLGIESPEGLMTVLSPSQVEGALGKAEREKLVAMDVVTKEAGALSVIEDMPTPMPKPRVD